MVPKVAETPPAIVLTRALFFQEEGVGGRGGGGHTHQSTRIVSLVLGECMRILFGAIPPRYSALFRDSTRIFSLVSGNSTRIFSLGSGDSTRIFSLVSGESTRIFDLI